LDDVPVLARHPKITLVIYETPMQKVRENVGISPSIDDISFGIEFDHRRRLMPGIQLVVRQIAPVKYENVVMGVYTNPTHNPCHPPVRQGFRPGWVNLEFGRINLTV
jgi:hypothetical protein